MSGVIRIAAVDDPIFLEGLKRVLRKAPNFDFFALGHTAADAIRIAQESNPDVLLLELDIPGSGVCATRTITASSPRVKVLMLTSSDDDECVRAAIDAGVTGYLTKCIAPAELKEAISTVATGKPYVSKSISSRLIARLFESRSPPPQKVFQMLNFRETQILEHAAKGMSNKEISKALSLETQTVKNYISRILHKLELPNRARAVAVYIHD